MGNKEIGIFFGKSRPVLRVSTIDSKIIKESILFNNIYEYIILQKITFKEVKIVIFYEHAHIETKHRI